MCIKQLATIICNPNRTPNEWCEILGTLFINWNINVDQVKTVIKAFTNRDLEAALQTQGFILIPCLVYELQVCIFIELSITYLFICFLFRNCVQHIVLKQKKY